MRIFCQEGRAGSCYAVAREDDLRDKDREAFKLVSKRACESAADGDGEASPAVAEACADFGLEEKDPVRAADALEKACNGNNAKGCTGLGLMYKQGEGRPKDEARARALLSRGCKLGEDFACRALDGRP